MLTPSLVFAYWMRGSMANVFYNTQGSGVTLSANSVPSIAPPAHSTGMLAAMADASTTATLVLGGAAWYATRRWGSSPVAETQDAARRGGGGVRRQFLPYHQGLARCATIGAAMYNQKEKQKKIREGNHGCVGR